MYHPRATISAKRLRSKFGFLESRAACCISAKMALSRGDHCLAMFSSFIILLMMTPAILLLLLKLMGSLYFQSSNSVLMVIAYPLSVAEHKLFLL
jgi:hypothetical protein